MIISSVLSFSLMVIIYFFYVRLYKYIRTKLFSNLILDIQFELELVHS
jgi:hypothetical protein